MSESEETTKNDEKKKGEYKFDLSDGLGLNDIIAIIIWIFKAIIFILKVVFYPYYWIWKEIGRTINFLGNPHEGPLTDDEKIYVKSVPFFFLNFGFFIGILIGAVVIFIKIEQIKQFLSGFKFDVLVQIVVDVINFIIDIIKAVILGIWDASTWLVGNIITIAAQNVLLTFIALSTLGFIAFILFLIITETDYVQRFWAFSKSSLSFIIKLPKNIYHAADNLYLKIITSLAAAVFGDKDLPYDMRFYRRVVGFSMGFSIYILFILLAILFVQNPDRPDQALLYAIVSVFGFGVLCGLISPYGLTKALARISKEKYLVGSETSEKAAE